MIPDARNAGSVGAMLLALAIASTLCAQPRPAVSARQIVTETEDNYCSCNLRGITVEADVTIETTTPYVENIDAWKATTMWLAPSKIRVDEHSPSGYWEINLNNGSEEAQLFSNSSPYRRQTPRSGENGYVPTSFRAPIFCFTTQYQGRTIPSD